MYFCVLKNVASSASTFGLSFLSVVFMGLVKFMYLIFIDFLGDFMEVFRKLLV